jgi:hypothetical protein
MICNLAFKALSSLVVAAPPARPKTVSQDTNIILARGLSEQLGIAVPDFTNEVAIGQTSFQDYTLYANGSGRGNENVDDEPPDTKSYLFHSWMCF